MALKTYSGGCHCGKVRFQADLDLSAGTNRCNCSLCTKARAWFALARGKDRFRVIAGERELSEYRWTPPGRSESNLTYRFCRNCGIRAFAGGDHESLGGVFHAVPVNALDDVDPDELAAAPIHYVDGKNDRFDRAPEDTRLM